MRAIGEFTFAHALEQLEVFLDRPLAVGARFARLADRATHLAYLGFGRTVDVGFALLDELDGEVVNASEVIGRVKHVFAPVEPKPPDVVLDGLDVLRVFGCRVGVVHAQVTLAAEPLRKAEVEADAFRMTDVQVPIRLGWKPRDDLLVASLSEVIGDDGFDEVVVRCWFVGIVRRVDGRRHGCRLHAAVCRCGAEPTSTWGEHAKVQKAKRCAAGWTNARPRLRSHAQVLRGPLPARSVLLA